MARLTRLIESPLAVVAAPLVVFAPALARQVLLAPADGFATHLPWQVLANSMWRRGVVPAWNPFTFSGTPFLASGQAGVFFPLNLAGVVLPPAIAYNLSVVLSFVVAGLGAWLLARRLVGDPVGATVAGLSFGLGGFMFGHVGHQSMIQTAAWLPWILYGFEVLRTRVTPRRVLAAALPVCLALLAGHTQMFALAIAVLALYAVISAPRRILAGVAMVTAGAGLAAIQLLPILMLLPHTMRADVSYEFATSYPMPSSHLWLLLFPYLFGNSAPLGRFSFPYGGEWNPTELAAYAGAAVVVLAVAGLPALRRDRRVAALAVCGLACLLVALGPDTELSRLVYATPVYGKMRAWSRYLVATDLAIAVLAAAGVAALRRMRAARVLVVAAAATMPVLAVVVPRLASVRPHVPGGRAAFFALALPVGAAASAAAAGLVIRRRPRLAAAALFAVVAGDLVGSYGVWCEWRLSPDPARVPDVLSGRWITWGRVADAPGGIDRYLFVVPDVGFVSYHFANATALPGWRSANGIDPLAQRGYLRALGMTPGGSIGAPDGMWRPGADVLDLLRVTTLVVDARAPVAPHPSVASGWTPAWEGALTRYTRTPALPDAFLLGRTERASFDGALDRVRGEVAFDPAATALVETRCERCPRGPPGAAGTVRRVRWRDREVTVDVRADRPALLVLSQAWSPGWVARVGGERVPVVRVDGLVQGVPVSAGRHRVRLEYRAPGLRTGALVSGATLLTLLAAAYAARRRLEQHSRVPEALL